MFGHLERKHVRSIGACQHHGVLGGADSFIGHHQGTAQLLAQLCQCGHIPLGNRLLNQAHACVDQLGQVAAGRIAVPGLVDVNGQRGAVRQAPRNLRDMCHIGLRRARTNFHFENAVAALLQPQLRFLQIALHITACQRPCQGQAVMDFAPQQLPGGNVQGACQRINQGHLDGRFGKGVAFAGLIHAGEHVLNTARLLLHHGGSQIVRNRMGNAFGGLFVPRRAANGGSLAKPACPVVQP